MHQMNPLLLREISHKDSDSKVSLKIHPLQHLHIGLGYVVIYLNFLPGEAHNANYLTAVS